MKLEIPQGSPADQVVQLKVSWTAYASLVASLDDERNARLTFDGRTLEIISPGPRHERLADRIDALLSTLVTEWDFNIEATRSTTFVRAGQAGFEADNSYYTQSAENVRDFDHLSLATDPPPDLVFEVDITSRRNDKSELYARLGIAEFWRYRNDRLAAFALVEGAFAAIGVSRVIPGLPIGAVQAMIDLPGSRLTMLTAWRNWLRENRHLRDSDQTT